MRRQFTSAWIRVIIAVAVGLACYLSTRQPARADTSLGTAALAPPAPGNLMIYRVGDGSAALTSAATAVFVDEYTTGGTLVQSMSMPTTAAGSQRRLTASGTAVSEGFLTLSEDRQYVVLTGYDAAVGTPAVAGTTSASTNRVIGRLNTSGNVDTSTAINDAFSGANLRSAASDDGTRFWATGANSGVRFVAFGSNGTSSDVSTTGTNLRQIKIGRGQLYATTGSGTVFRLGTVGTGLPTTSGQTITNLPGFPTSGSPYSFYFADLDGSVTDYDTLYVADDIAGAIQKYSLVSGSWTPNGSITLTSVRGLTGIHSGPTVTLYVTYGGTSNTLGQVVDTSGYNIAPAATTTVIATAAANTAFRGVAFAPGTSPTAVEVLSLSANTNDSTAILPLIVLGTMGIAALAIRRSRAS